MGLGGKGTARLPGPSQPSPSPSPPQGLAVFRDKGPLRPQTQLGEGNSGDQSYFGIFRLKIFQPRPAQAAHTPQRNREGAWNQESAPWTRLTHNNMQLYTHVHTSGVPGVTHTPTQVCVGTGVSCVHAHRVSLTHQCTYALGTSHTHSPSCNTARSSSTQHTYTRVRTHRLWLYFSGPEKEGGGWGLERTESSL